MNANIMKTHFFNNLKYDFKGHKRSQKVIKNFQIIFQEYIFCLTADLLKTFQEYQHYEDTNFSQRLSKVIYDHVHSSTCIYSLILMKICMNANNIIKTQFLSLNYI